MVSPFFGLEIAKRGLAAARTALDTVGHNIANASNPDYSRQEVTFESTTPLFQPSLKNKIYAGQLGTGTEISSISRVIDPLLSQRLGDALQKKSAFEEKANILRQVEDILGEPSDNGLRAVIDNFFLSFNELSTNPESAAARQQVIEQGNTLADTFNDIYTRIQRLGGVGIVGDSAVDTAILDSVEKINQIGREIADLNLDIRSVEVAGNNPNDLLDRRDALIRELTEMINTQVSEAGADEFRVLVGGQVLVQGNLFNALDTKRNSQTDQLDIVSTANDSEVFIKEGKLATLREMARETIPEFLAKLDDLAEGIVNRVNELHRTGFGLDEFSPSTGVDFFAPFESKDEDANEIYALTGSQSIELPDQALNGDSSDPLVPQNFEFNPIQSGGLIINGIQVTYDADADSINDIITRINNSGSGIVARLDGADRFVLQATRSANYRIDSLKDTGNLLERLGVTVAKGTIPGSQGIPSNTLNDSDVINVAARIERPPRSPGLALNVSINEEILLDPNKIAAAGGTDTDNDGIPDLSNGPGDGSNALKLSELRNALTMGNETASFSSFYAQFVSSIGTQSATAQSDLERSESEVLNLQNLRQSISGVSLDEELTNLIKFQRSFQANARVIRIQDEVLQTILSLGQ